MAILFAIILNELYLSSEQFSCCDIALAQTTIWREALKLAGPILIEILAIELNRFLFKNSDIYIEEIISPKLYKEFLQKEAYFEAEYDIEDELKQLLELSTINHEKLIQNHWGNVLPIYPIEPVN